MLRLAVKNNGQTPRRAPRLGVRIPAQMRERGSLRYRCKVLDISQMGFRFETALRIPIGATVWLKIPDIAELAAEIEWHRGNEYGCSFEAPMHQAVVDHVAKHYPALA